jgi:hypothetical protein
MRREFDKYYTPIDIIRYLNKKIQKIIDFNKINYFLDPCCGDNRWKKELKEIFPDKKFKTFDIAPDNDSINKGDYLKKEFTYKKDRIIYTNPPYGTRNLLSLRFINKALKEAGYVAMLVPMTCKYSNKCPIPDYYIPVKHAFDDCVTAVKTALLIWTPGKKRYHKANNWDSDEDIRYKIFVKGRDNLPKLNSKTLAFCDWGCGSLYKIVYKRKKFYSKTMIIKFKSRKQKIKFKKYLIKNRKKLRNDYIRNFGESASVNYPYLRKLLKKVLGYKSDESEVTKNNKYEGFKSPFA